MLALLAVAAATATANDPNGTPAANDATGTRTLVDELPSEVRWPADWRRVGTA
jgi:hypothetical protein